MKTITKRIICIFLCITAFAMMLPAFAEDSNEAYSEEIKALKEFGIALRYTNGAEDVTRKMTRADLAAMAVTILNLDGVEYTTANTVFSDVTESHWASGYIDAAQKLGLINGAGGGMYYPENPVSMENAVKVIMGALGYDELAAAKGGYPTGYLAVASGEKLLDGVSFADVNSITVAEMLAMVYHATDIPLLKQYSFGGVERYESSNSVTLLTEYFDIYKGEGTVHGNDKTMTADRAALGEARVLIGDTIYNEGTTDIANYLGCYVEYYYKKTDKASGDYIVSFSVDGTEVYTIESDDIAGYSDYELSYSNENGKLKVYKLSTVADVIFNGKYKSHYTDSDLMPVNGVLRLIDNDGNGVMDVVIVESYITYTVEKLNTDRKTVYDKHEQKPLSLEADTDRAVTLISEGREADFSDIKAGDILTVAADVLTVAGGVVSVADSAEAIKVYISRETASGKLEAISEATNKLTIDGIEYSLSDGDSTRSKIGTDITNNLGRTLTFCLDYFGKIADIAGETDSNNKYGFVTKCDSNGAFLTSMGMFNAASSKYEVLNLAANVNVDGKRISAEKAVEALKTDENGAVQSATIPQLIAYELDSNGKIRSIDTAKLGADETPESSLTRGIPRASYRYHANSKSFGGRFAMGGDSILICVPTVNGVLSAEVDASNTEGFYMGSLGYLTTSAEYEMETYNTEDGIAEIAIRYYNDETDNGTVIPYNNRSTLVVDRVIKTEYNGEEAYLIYALAGSSGQEVELYCTENTMVVDQKTETTATEITPKALKRGDILRYTCGTGGDVASRIERILTFKQGNTYTAPNKTQYVMRKTANEYFSNYLLTYGYLYTNREGIAQIAFNDGGADDRYVYNYTVNNAKNIILYDEGADKLSVVSCDDLYSFSHTQSYNTAARVATFSSSGSIYAVFAYLAE